MKVIVYVRRRYSGYKSGLKSVYQVYVVPFPDGKISTILGTNISTQCGPCINVEDLLHIPWYYIRHGAVLSYHIYSSATKIDTYVAHGMKRVREELT